MDAGARVPGRGEEVGVVGGTGASFARFVVDGLHRDLTPQGQERFFVDFAQQAPEQLATMWRWVGPQVPARARDLAAPSFERLALQRVLRLSKDQQLGAVLGKGTLEPSSKKARKERDAAIRALSRDPAIERNFARIEDSWLEGLLPQTADEGLLYTTLEELVELKVLLARNLYSSGLEVDREHVRAEWIHLLELRRQYGDLPVFLGRDVVLVATPSETPSSGDQVFASKRLRRSLERSAAELTVYGGGQTQVPLPQVLDRARSADELTFFFAGHGRVNALRYQGGLEVEALARALAGYARSDDGQGRRAIVLILACSGHDFARNLLSALQRIAPEVPKPILITAEEYGQPWVTETSGGDLERLLTRQAPTPVTLARLGHEGPPGVSVLVPDRDNIPRQIF